MTTVTAPDFGALLSPFIGQVPEHAVPNFLALLERGAAARYRYWAEQLPQYSEGLLQCSASEDKIADIIESIFLIDEELAEEIQKPLPDARETYYKVFESMSIPDQLAVQADAELQGAEAWNRMLSDDLPEAISNGLKQCMALEKESSAYLYSILDEVREAAA